MDGVAGAEAVVATTLHKVTLLVQQRTIAGYVQLFEDFVELLESLLVLVTVRKVLLQWGRCTVPWRHPNRM